MQKVSISNPSTCPNCICDGSEQGCTVSQRSQQHLEESFNPYDPTVRYPRRLTTVCVHCTHHKLRLYEGQTGTCYLHHLGRRQKAMQYFLQWVPPFLNCPMIIELIPPSLIDCSFHGIRYTPCRSIAQSFPVSSAAWMGHWHNRSPSHGASRSARHKDPTLAPPSIGIGVANCFHWLSHHPRTLLWTLKHWNFLQVEFLL